MTQEALSSEAEAAAEQDAGTETEHSDADLDGENQETPASEQAKDEPKDEFVPLEKHQNLQNAVAQSRHIQRELKAENRELTEKIQKMESTFQTILERSSKQAEPSTSFEDDPIKNLQEQNDILKKRLEEMESKPEASANVHGQQQQPDITPEQQELIDEVRRHTEAFTEKHPDYPKAYEHWFKGRVAELRDLGYSQEDMQMTVGRELAQISQSALDRGENPAEQVYALAKKSGYAAQAQKSQKDLDELAKQQEVTKSLGSGGGGSPSLEEMASMETDELDLALKEMGFTK